MRNRNAQQTLGLHCPTMTGQRAATTVSAPAARKACAKLLTNSPTVVNPSDETQVER